MNTLVGIVRKELKIYFTTPIAYVVFALWLHVRLIGVSPFGS